MDASRLIAILSAYIDGTEQGRARHLAAMLRDEIKRAERDKWEKGFKGFDGDIKKPLTSRKHRPLSRDGEHAEKI